MISFMISLVPPAIRAMRASAQARAIGRSIASFQNTRFKLAEIKAKAAMMRVFVDRCMELHVAGKLDATDAAIAKL